MPKIENILSTEEDFTTLIDALDCYCREASTYAYAYIAAEAAIEAGKEIKDDEELDARKFERSIISKINRDKVQESANKIRDKVILLKAKVISTKEILNEWKIRREIDGLTADGV